MKHNASGFCIDSMGGDTKAGLQFCDSLSGDQVWLFSKDGRIRLKTSHYRAYLTPKSILLYYSIRYKVKL